MKHIPTFESFLNESKVEKEFELEIINKNGTRTNHKVMADPKTKELFNIVADIKKSPNVKDVHIVEQEELTEASKKGLDNTQWAKWPDSKTGDVFKSKRQGVLAVRVDNALRPMHYYTDPVIWMNQGFDTDKQFTEKIKPDSKSIADAYYEMHNSGSHTREKADAFGKAAEAAIKKILKGEKLPMPVVLDDE